MTAYTEGHQFWSPPGETGTSHTGLNREEGKEIKGCRSFGKSKLQERTRKNDQLMKAMAVVWHKKGIEEANETMANTFGALLVNATSFKY